jgi:spermidine synthase
LLSVPCLGGIPAATGQHIFHAIFFLSGAAALIYQVCWQRLMSVYYGVGAISIAIVVSVFMLGLGLGALLGGRIADRADRPLLVYAGVEAVIGMFGLASLSILTHIGRATAGSSYEMTFVWSFAFLLLPTVLMGMTLPIAIGILQRIDSSVLRDTSGYYFSNTLGAALGAIACGYVLLSFVGLDGAIYAAVAINIFLAGTIFFVAKADASPVPERSSGAASGLLPALWRRILLLLFLNGFFAIGYQIIWYRLVGALLKDSAYAFSTILAVYLLGIGLGSLWLYRRGLPRLAGREFAGYLWLNALVGIASFAAVLLLFWLGPHEPLSSLIALTHRYEILPWIGNPADWHGLRAYLITAATFALMLFWPTLMILMPTFLMGAAFPVGIALAAGDGRHAARGASIGYAATIAGNTLGGLVTQFVLLPAAGTAAVLAAFCAIQIALLLMPAGAADGGRILYRRVASIAGVALVLALTPVSEELYRRIHKPAPAGATAHFAEGLEGVAMVYEDGGRLENFINGSAHGTRPGGGYVNEAFVALSHVESPQDVLVIGYGAGALVHALLADERVKTMTLVELNKNAFDNLMKVPRVAQELADPRVTVLFDDGRRYLQRNSRKFDLISMDPIRTRSAFSNNLYSVDFFRLTREALNPGGAILVWCGDDLTGGVKKAVAAVYGDIALQRYFMVASAHKSRFSPAVYDGLLQEVSPQVASDMKRFQGPAVGDRDTIIQGTAAVPLNTDLTPYSEYFLGSVLRRPPSLPQSTTEFFGR